ncbi:MAG: hypothetical protein PHV07_01640 [Oscillospiraceae bacterium]|nr:hypothetical protein [Oscillospiraceae bacterium]
MASITNKNYKYDELTYAEEIYKAGRFLTKYYPTEMRLLTLYYRDVLNLKPAKREEYLIKFCEGCIPSFNIARYYKIIDATLNRSRDKKQKLIRVEKIDIYKQELEYILSLDIQYNYKKILLAFLVQMKLNKYIYEIRNNKEYNSLYFKGDKKKYQNIKDMANVPSNVKIHEDAIYDMAHNHKGLISLLHSGLIILDFLKECVPSGDIAFSIRDFNNVGWYLDYYCNMARIKLCKECENPFYAKANSQKYCKNCSTDIQYYQPIKTKVLTCIDCGKVFEVVSKDTKSDRCNDCERIYRLEYQRILMQKRKKNLA